MVKPSSLSPPLWQTNLIPPLADVNIQNLRKTHIEMDTELYKNNNISKYVLYRGIALIGSTPKWGTEFFLSVSTYCCITLLKTIINHHLTRNCLFQCKACVDKKKESKNTHHWTLKLLFNWRHTISSERLVSSCEVLYPGSRSIQNINILNTKLIFFIPHKSLAI